MHTEYFTGVAIDQEVGRPPNLEEGGSILITSICQRVLEQDNLLVVKLVPCKAAAVTSVNVWLMISTK